MKLSVLFLSLLFWQSFASASSVSCAVVNSATDKLTVQIVGQGDWPTSFAAYFQRTGYPALTVQNIALTGKNNFGLSWQEYNGSGVFKLAARQDFNETPSIKTWSLTADIPQLGVSFKDIPISCEE